MPLQDFRKKPVVVQAVRITEAWIRTHGPTEGPLATAVDYDPARPEIGVSVRTLEGTMRGNLGDWLIVGVAGEVYPCRDDVFRSTYERLFPGPVEGV